MVDLVEEVRISHSSAANHDCVSPDFFDALFGFLDRTDITVGDEGNLGQSLSDLVKSLKVCVACIHLFTGTAMHGEGRNTCSFSSEGIFYCQRWVSPAGTHFDSKWNIKDRLDLVDDRVNFIWILEPHSASFVLHDFVNWAAHVDIHDIGLSVFLDEFCCAC